MRDADRFQNTADSQQFAKHLLRELNDYLL